MTTAGRSLQSSHLTTDTTTVLLQTGSLKILQFNANALLGHLDILKEFLETRFFHIISIAETWLHAGISDALVNLNDYFIIRNDRVGKIGGGIAVYIHNSLKVNVLDSSPSQFSNSPEYLLLEVRPPHCETVLFTSMYRRPKAKLFSDFSDSFSKFSCNFKNIIIIGDLNCNMLTNNFEAQSLRDFIFTRALFLVPSEATYHTSYCDSWLDVAILDSEEKLSSFKKTSAPFIAGHDAIEICLNLNQVNRVTSPITLKRRCIAKLNESIFNQDLTTELEKLSHSDVVSPCKLVERIINVTQTIATVFDVHAPLRTFTTRKLQTPWITAELKCLIRERNALYKHAKRSGNILAFMIYRHFRDKVTTDIRKAKETYLLDRLSAVSDSNHLWKELANLGIVKPRSSSPLHFFSAEQLNVYYASISILIHRSTVLLLSMNWRLSHLLPILSRLLLQLSMKLEIYSC